MTIPFIEDCAGYHLFGTSEAASVANIVNPAKPLIKVGTPTYPAANYAQVDFNSELQGFRTTDSFPNRNATALAMMTWPRNAADTGYAALRVKSISMNDGAIYLLWFASTDHQFITGPGTGISDGLANNRRPSFNQDNDQGVRVTGPHRYALMAMVDTGSEARMTLQEGYQLKQFTGTPAAAPVSSPIFFGGQGFLGNAVFRIASCAYFNRALDFAAISDVWKFMSENLAERGIT